MVRFERTVRIRPGKFVEALQWANEVARFVNGKFSDNNELLVFNRLFGDYPTIAWAVDAPDLATMESTLQQLVADPAYWAVVNKGADLLVEGTGHDALWQQAAA
jgi:hypothetical protein